jgi:hypothetical protein
MKRKRIDEIDIINSVFAKIAEFLMDVEIITLATIHPSLVKFTSQYHPMIYNVWGIHRCPSVKFYDALRLLDWGRWGRAIGNNQRELYFQLILMNLAFRVRISFHNTWGSRSDVGTQSRFEDARGISNMIYAQCYFNDCDNISQTINIPKIIPRHEVRKTLFPMLDTLFQDVQTCIFGFLQSNPWILVCEKTHKNMTSEKWFKVASLFEKNENESKSFNNLVNFENLKDFYSVKNVLNPS